MSCKNCNWPVSFVGKMLPKEIFRQSPHHILFLLNMPYKQLTSVKKDLLMYILANSYGKALWQILFITAPFFEKWSVISFPWRDGIHWKWTSFLLAWKEFLKMASAYKAAFIPKILAKTFNESAIIIILCYLSSNIICKGY